jgi:ADP-ribose pyrophosphatase YjhB (NUDIX family)
MTQRLPDNFETQTPPGDDKPRLVCGTCGFINYVNPKIVAGAVVVAPDGRVLLARRAIEPRRTFWTVPAGFMEEKESTRTAAAREVREEACAEVEIDALLGMYEVPRISQVHIMYRARLLGGFAAGPESLDVALFDWDEIPWSDMAFPTGVWALRDWYATRDQAAFPCHGNPAGSETMTGVHD